MMKAGFIIIFLFFPIVTFSQEETIADSSKFERLTKFQVVSLGHLNYSASDLNGNAGEIQISEYAAKLNFAIKIKEKKTFLLNRINLNLLEYKYNNEFTNINNRLYALSYNIGILQVLKNRWMMVGMINPTLASDLKQSVSTEDFILQSTLLFRKRASRYLEYGLGLSFNTRFGRELLVPLVSFDYKKGNWSTSNVLPGYISGFYHFKKSKIGLSADIYGNVYNPSSQNLAPELEVDKTSYTRITVGPKYLFNFYKDFYCDVSFGVCMYNRLEAFDRNSAHEVDLTTKEKFFFRIALDILK